MVYGLRWAFSVPGVGIPTPLFVVVYWYLSVSIVMPWSYTWYICSVYFHIIVRFGMSVKLHNFIELYNFIDLVYHKHGIGKKNYLQFYSWFTDFAISIWFMEFVLFYILFHDDKPLSFRRKKSFFFHFWAQILFLSL